MGKEADGGQETESQANAHLPGLLEVVVTCHPL